MLILMPRQGASNQSIDASFATHLTTPKVHGCRPGQQIVFNPIEIASRKAHMTKSAKTVQYFGMYLVILSFGLMVAPNLLLPLFGVPPTTEVWIRVAGLIVLNEGVGYWFAAKSNATPFFHASCYVRCLNPFVFGAYVLVGWASPALVGFGLVDFAGAIWTFLTLRSEAQTFVAG